MSQMNRRFVTTSNRSIEEPEESSEEESENSSDDSSSGKGKDNGSTVKLYVLMVLSVLFCLSYLYERDLRFKLIHEFNDSIDHASAQLFEARQKISASTSESNSVVSLDKCPRCPTSTNCAEEQPLTEEEKPITETDVLLEEWNQRDKAVMSTLQGFAKSALLDKFGNPPYYVEFNIGIEAETPVEGGKLVIEMAPIDLMPYSVLYFLSQVSAGVWDSCSLFINLGVVYLEDARGSTTICDRDKFKHVPGIPEFLPFQEYSPEYRHEELTVGISGRPGGLGFYINASNNTKPLGPRGDYSPGGVPLPADPAIGKLIRGAALFVRMKRIESTVDGVQQRLFQDIFRFQQVVTILSSRILSADELPPE